MVCRVSSPWAFAAALIAASALATGCAGTTAAPTAHPALDCAARDCGLRGPHANPHIVVGTIEHVAMSAEMQGVYEWAKASGRWREFADDEGDYVRRNVLLALAAPYARQDAVLVHMSREEFGRAEWQPGDLVRYVPRTAGFETEPAGGPSRFSVLAGCVAILCRAEDAACLANYVPGVFRRDTGIQLDPRSEMPLVGGATIDPLTLLPLTARPPR